MNSYPITGGAGMTMGDFVIGGVYNIVYRPFFDSITGENIEQPNKGLGGPFLILRVHTYEYEQGYVASLRDVGKTPTAFYDVWHLTRNRFLCLNPDTVTSATKLTVHLT